MTSATQGQLRVENDQETLHQTLVDLEATEDLRDELNGKIRALRKTIQKLTTTIDGVEGRKKFDWQQQYDTAISHLRADALASFEPTLEAVEKVFTPEQKEAIALLRNPKLLFVPHVSFAAKIRAINERGFAPCNTYVNKRVFGSVSEEGKKEQASSVRPVIVETQHEMDLAAYDDTRVILKDRIATYKRNKSSKVCGIDRDTYALLQLHALRRGNPIDQETWTILDTDEVSEENTVIPVGNWNDVQGTFGRYPAGLRCVSARFRSLVKGDVLQHGSS